MNKVFTSIIALSATSFAMLGADISFSRSMKVESSEPEVINEMIWDQPEGNLTWLDRTCDGFKFEIFNSVHSQIYGSIVQRVDAEDGSVYLSHLASEYPVNTWTKFEREGNQLIMNGIHAVWVEYDEGNDESFYVYIAPMKVVIDEEMKGTCVVPEDCRFIFNEAEDGTLTAADPEMMLGICVRVANSEEDAGTWMWQGYGDRCITMAPVVSQPVLLPEGLETEDWVWSDDSSSCFVKVAQDGEDFYINGLDRSLPDAWVKGHVWDTALDCDDYMRVTFPSGQYLGADMAILYYSYFYGAEFSDEEDEDGNPILVASLADNSTFTFNPDKKILQGDYMINSSVDKLFPLYFYDWVEVRVQNRNPDTVPDAPYDLSYFESDWGDSVWFQLPNVDEDGNLLVESNLYYEVFVDGELVTFTVYDEYWNESEMSRIPYLFDDEYTFFVYGEDHTAYLPYPAEESIAIRSIYINENGEEIYSKTGYLATNGVDGVSTGKTLVSEYLYDLQGRLINSSNAGIAIKVSTYSDGTVSREKVVVK